MSVRYIGSKVRLTDVIVGILGGPGEDGYLVDAFCGTGAVARAAARAGWAVRINDHLYSSVVTAGAALLSRTDVPFEGFGGYEAALSRLSAAPALQGFITREYSPASRLRGDVERRYFTAGNAARIDGFRVAVANWAALGALTVAEERLLVADVLRASNRVANIAGTYGCFLRDWSAQALRELTLAPRVLLEHPVTADATVGDVRDVPVAPDDVVYYDPPYTKRQYAAYYHLLETIAYGDEPDVSGVTGLRPWRHLASAFCYRKRALDAIVGLVATCPARRVLLSYSSEGHVERAPLLNALQRVGRVEPHAVDGVARYRPNRAASSAASSVTEFIFEVHPFDTVAAA